MKIVPLHVAFPSLTHRYPFHIMSNDILVNSIGGVSVNQSYRNVNQPIHVEPAAKLFLSPAALKMLTKEHGQ
jgi:hypothetical protein